MTFHWRYEDVSGAVVEGPADTFVTQAEAEDWFSSTWTGLLDAGIEQVVLLDDDVEVYGPMSLRPQA